MSCSRLARTRQRFSLSMGVHRSAWADSAPESLMPSRSVLVPVTPARFCTKLKIPEPVAGP